MGKIFKQLARHWAACLAVVALLFVQAYCDLSLPDYTSRIVDTGIHVRDLLGIAFYDNVTSRCVLDVKPHIVAARFPKGETIVLPIVSAGQND